MTEEGFSVVPMSEEHLPEVLKIENEAFAGVLARLAGEHSACRAEGDRIANRFYRPDTYSIVLRDAEEQVQGAQFVQRMGMRCVIGPLAVRPSMLTAYWAGQAICEYLPGLVRRIGCEWADSVTFPQSPVHFMLHWRDMDPALPQLVLTRAIRNHRTSCAPPCGLRLTPWSGLDATEQRAMLAGMTTVTDRFTRGFDLTADVRHVASCRLGETIVATRGDEVLAFAICHFGEGSEAFRDGELLVKSLYVDSSAPDASAVFESLMETIEEKVAAERLDAVTLMVDSGRRLMLETLVLARKYRVVQIHQHFVGRDLAGVERPCATKQHIAQIGGGEFAAAELR